MQLQWNAKGDTAATVIMWIGSLLAVIICITWLVQNISADHITLEKIDYEMNIMQEIFSTACNMNYYRYKYNPMLREGYLILNESDLCIDSSSCKPLYFDSENEPKAKDNKIVIEEATLCSIPKNCKALYYVGEQEPYILDDSIIIEEAAVCQQTSIIRCRLLICSTNINANIDFKKITYIVIEKKEDGTFSITTE